MLVKKYQKKFAVWNCESFFELTSEMVGKLNKQSILLTVWLGLQKNNSFYSKLLFSQCFKFLITCPICRKWIRSLFLYFFCLKVCKTSLENIKSKKLHLLMRKKAGSSFYLYFVQCQISRCSRSKEKQLYFLHYNFLEQGLHHVTTKVCTLVF